MKNPTLKLALLSLLLAGCTLEPHYVRPQPAVTQQWPAPPAGYEAAAEVSERSAAQIGWREFFTDAKLQTLIEQALQHNPDAQVASLNIAAARAQYQIQRASLFPKISASAVEQVQRFPTGVTPTAGSAGGTTTAAGSGLFRYFDVGVGFTSYELDLFGRIRSLNHSRLQQYLGYVETRRSTQISVIAEVASAYLTWLADSKLLRITMDTLNSQQESLTLVRMSFDGGVATALDLHQAETTVATAQANLAQYGRQVAQDQNALVVLLGAPMPSDVIAEEDLDEEKLLTDLPAGLPSDILVQRPDILAAEHNLIAANANIGAARAAFFPSILLTGSYGTASTQLSGLFQPRSQAWTFSPQISLPIFAGGANVASLDLAKVQKNILIVQYQQAIQNGFREVADALAGRATLDSQVAADTVLVEASSESFRLSNMRYTGGVDNYLGVLDAQRILYTAQQSLVSVKLARLQNLVTLYKALGGGWREHTDPT
ncbi:MAG: outer membrane protein multidrug efflux system [Gammaproteobacteria bacterium]|nr:outer membrane protein multidrug efflux system [Gammaproteobacteria bacterium]